MDKRNPEIQKYVLFDGVKGWIRETINPTLKANGWKQAIIEYDYGLFMNEKPKDMAIRLLIDTFGEEWTKDKKFVYNPYYYTGIHTFMDVLYVFYKFFGIIQTFAISTVLF